MCLGPVQTLHTTTGKPHSPSLGETKEMGILELQQDNARGREWGRAQLPIRGVLGPRGGQAAGRGVLGLREVQAAGQGCAGT